MLGPPLLLSALSLLAVVVLLVVFAPRIKAFVGSPDFAPSLIVTVVPSFLVGATLTISLALFSNLSFPLVAVAGIIAAVAFYIYGKKFLFDLGVLKYGIDGRIAAAFMAPAVYDEGSRLPDRVRDKADPPVDHNLTGPGLGIRKTLFGDDTDWSERTASDPNAAITERRRDPRIGRLGGFPGVDD